MVKRHACYRGEGGGGRCGSIHNNQDEMIYVSVGLVDLTKASATPNKSGQTMMNAVKNAEMLGVFYVWMQ